jgi:hypothetical protein
VQVGVSKSIAPTTTTRLIPPRCCFNCAWWQCVSANTICSSYINSLRTWRHFRASMAGNWASSLPTRISTFSNSYRSTSSVTRMKISLECYVWFDLFPLFCSRVVAYLDDRDEECQTSFEIIWKRFHSTVCLNSASFLSFSDSHSLGSFIQAENVLWFGASARIYSPAIAEGWTTFVQNGMYCLIYFDLIRLLISQESNRLFYIKKIHSLFSFIEIDSEELSHRYLFVWLLILIS